MKYLLLLLLASCSATPKEVVVSVREQKVKYGARTYKCSTSKFGLGDQPGSFKTPTGKFQVVEKIGENLPINTGFKARVPTRRLGHDGIVSRIIRIKGLEESNKNAYARMVYIHGTPHINDLGLASSYGCVRMSPQDVADLCKKITNGTEICIK